MKNITKHICTFLFLLLSFQTYAKDSKTENQVIQGKKIYTDNCTMCHGDAGDGNGPVGKNLTPKPTHLKAYNAKQIVKILNDGKIAMMAHLKSGLTADQKEAVAIYAEKTFAKK